MLETKLAVPEAAGDEADALEVDVVTDSDVVILSVWTGLDVELLTPKVEVYEVDD